MEEAKSKTKIKAATCMYPSSVIVTEGHRSPSRAIGFDEKNFDIWKIRQGNLLARKSYVRNNFKSKIDCLTYFIYLKIVKAEKN